MTQSKQQVSIIIPHFNQEVMLVKCLTAVFGQTDIANLDQEVIIVDDGSSGDISEKLAGFDIILIKTTGSNNPYICRNLGISNAKYEQMAFLDASCIPESTWLINGLRALKSADVVAGKFEVDYKHGDLHSIAYKAMYLNNAMHINKGGAVPAGNFFTTRKVFNAIGFFNELSRSGGDTEWSIRARAKGMNIVYAEKAVVRYPGKTKTTFYNAVKRYGKGARKQWLPIKGSIWVTLNAMRSMTPIFPTLTNSLAPLSITSKLKTYMIIWKARIMFGIKMLVG